MSKSPQQRKEPLSLRIEPKIKYLIEIASRVQRRNISNYVEYVIEESLKNVEIEKDKSIYEVSRDIWSENEGERLMLLEDKYPDLLTFEEIALLSTVKRFFYYSFHIPKEKYTDQEIEQFITNDIVAHWDIIKLATNYDPDAISWLALKKKAWSVVINGEEASDSDIPEYSQEKLTAFAKNMLDKKYQRSIFEDKIWSTIIGSKHFFLKDIKKPISLENLNIIKIGAAWKMIYLSSFFSPEMSAELFLLGTDSLI